MTAEWLAALYNGLARTLALDVNWPDWLGSSGRQWPLWEPATRLAATGRFPGLAEAVASLSEVPSASRSQRQTAFEETLSGNGSSPTLLYQSHYLQGRLLGPDALVVEALYRQMGLELEGAELPDHASVELEFLAYLAENEAVDPAHGAYWRSARRLFIKQHAGRWLPGVGARLARGADPAWRTIGQLLAAVVAVPAGRRKQKASQAWLPQVLSPEACTLCGFCAQVCPTHALWVDEDEEMTRLRLVARHCIGCRKCEQVCDQQALSMRLAADSASGLSEENDTVLRQSPRAICPGCGCTTVSTAELEAVAAMLETHPSWLDYCLECRALAF